MDEYTYFEMLDDFAATNWGAFAGFLSEHGYGVSDDEAASLSELIKSRLK